MNDSLRNYRFRIENEQLRVEGKDIYGFLTNQYLHQNQLSWSRLQTIFAIEAGILAWFFSFGSSLAISSLGLLLGTCVVWLLYRLVIRDWEIRDQNLHLLDEVHEQIGISMIQPTRHSVLSGNVILRVLCYGAIALNISVCLLKLHGFV